MASLQIMLVKNNSCKFQILLKATYICPGSKVFCFSKLKLTTAWDVTPWTLWIVRAHDSLKGNCVLCFDNELQEFPAKIYVSFLIGTQLFVWQICFLQRTSCQLLDHQTL